MKIGSVNSKNFVKCGFRIDPDIHLSEGVQVRNAVNALPYKISTIGANSERVFLGNIFSRVFVTKPEFGLEYLSASDTVLSDLHTRKYLSKKQAEKLSYLKLKKDWIVVTCSGTLGNVTYTNSLFEDKIVTHDLIRIVPDDKVIKKGVMYAFLASRYGYHQITQTQFGGVVKHINDEQAKAIKIPIFPDDFQSKIDTLIQDSARLREEATEALEKAKEIIEKFVGVSKFNKTFGLKTNSFKIQTIKKSFNTRLDPSFFINDGINCIESIDKKCKRLGDCNVKIWYPGIFKRAYVENGYPYIKGSSLFDVNPFKSCDKLSKTKTPNLNELWLKEGMIMTRWRN